MKRLTYDFCIGGNHCWQVKGADNLECREVCERQGDDGCKTCPIAKAFDRLAAYEDTGLEPEEVLPKEYAGKIMKSMILLKEYQSIGSIDRLRELAQADREGRCVVLPPDDYTWTIRGDIIRGIIHANCRAAKKEAEAALQGEREEKQ